MGTSVCDRNRCYSSFNEIAAFLILCALWGLSPLLYVHSSSRQNCRTTFALRVSKHKAAFFVVSGISQLQLGWALQELSFGFVSVCSYYFPCGIKLLFFSGKKKDFSKVHH